MVDSGVNGLLRSIPAMDELLNAPWAGAFYGCLGRETVKGTIAEALDGVKRDICAGVSFKLPPGEVVALRSESLLRMRASSTLKRVVNATGVVAHTNLGRAPLADEAVRAVRDVSGVYSTLEYSLEHGGRGGRNSHVEWLVCRMTGAEAALAVNNNAAAVLLALSATAAGREVIVSCGELVEIGDSFRIPEILAFSGAKMKAVGCTNATHIGDYRNAVTEDTAVLLKVHPSNYRIDGFVKSTSREELAVLASSRGLVFMEDLGSGLLCQPDVSFANPELSVRDCLQAGSGIVTFSGDKLLGGPQIGVIAGSKDLIDKMKRHQLLRALRVDKMTLAAFEATLRIYLSGRQGEIPVIRMIEADATVLLKRARALCGILNRVTKEFAAKRRTAGLPDAGDYGFRVAETRDAAGGGAYPVDALPGYGVGIRSGPSVKAETLAAALRSARVPVVAGIRDGTVILHVRTLLPGDEKLIAASFAEAISRCAESPPLEQAHI
ncbi:MAG: L-seryl-tRNA(Sec) selenium transferase [Spirochaetaceae bacterium]|jgi:L-seryl-tRNA(Ser) seleniumtransferase|nr:L-seryl-tRNA(Sec) selenium transferase [Spirochaetaceae bacterium]